MVAQTSPAVFGHSSEEIKFLILPAAPGSIQYNDCTSVNTFSCVARCEDDPSVVTEYRALAGSCTSESGTRWGFTGIAADNKGWECVDSSRAIGQIFLAQVICVEIGK